jgi:DNA-binding NtrC family response regulator
MTHFVLLVDDDENLLHGLARTLRRQPYRLYTARSGDEAMHVLKSRAVDAIVADEQMPGMSGTELLAWAAQHYPDVVRIVLTGRATAETAIRAINEGAVYHFFRKPCDVVQLAITIRKALEHKDLLAENRRLLQLHGRQPPGAERLCDDLAALERLIAAELEEPLQRLAQGGTTAGPGNRLLLDSVLLAAARARSLAAGLCNASAAGHECVVEVGGTCVSPVS